METPFSPEPRNPDEFLFHYTSSATFLNYILPTGTIRFSPMSEVNDPKESSFAVSAFYGSKSIDGVRSLQRQWQSFFQSRVKAACFSRDDPSIAVRGEEHVFHGWAKPTMWAHYAENHQGICVVFRRELLLNAFTSSHAATLRTFHGNVNYQEFRAISERYMEKRFELHRAHVAAEELESDFNTFVLGYLDKHHEEIYFRKHGDWSGESEYRLLMVSQNDGFEFLEYSDSIAGVCTGLAMEDSERTSVKKASEMAKIPHMQLTAETFR